MIHIVFQEADVQILQQAIDMDETLEGAIIQVKDDYAVGPVKDIGSTEGYQARRDWWIKALEYSPYAAQINLVDDKLALHQLVKRLIEEPETDVWIWMAQNQHDVCGYYWLIGQLKDFQNRVQVLYLNNLPFINEKGGLFYPTALHEILPKEFLKAKKLARPVTASEFEIDPDEWIRLCNENAGVRLLEGGKKIVGKTIDFYDKQLLSFISKDPQKLVKILHGFYSKAKISTGDVFLAWRIRELVTEGILTAEGDWTRGWKEITIRLSGEPSPENVPAEQETA